jgi:hypothetical protein
MQKASKQTKTTYTISKHDVSYYQQHASQIPVPPSAFQIPYNSSLMLKVALSWISKCLGIGKFL